MRVLSLTRKYVNTAFEGQYTVVELELSDEGRTVYASAGSGGEGVDFAVSTGPVSDLLLTDCGSEDELRLCCEKLDSLITDRCSVLWDDDVPEELEKSRYNLVFRLCLMTLVCFMTTEIEDEVSDEEFIAPYLGAELAALDIPEFDFSEDGISPLERIR